MQVGQGVRRRALPAETVWCISWRLENVEVEGARWLLRSSKPSCRLTAAGGFDSHAPPPYFTRGCVKNQTDHGTEPDARRSLPSVSALLDTAPVRGLLAAHPRCLVVDAVRRALARHAFFL